MAKLRYQKSYIVASCVLGLSASAGLYAAAPSVQAWADALDSDSSALEVSTAQPKSSAVENLAGGGTSQLNLDPQQTHPVAPEKSQLGTTAAAQVGMSKSSAIDASFGQEKAKDVSKSSDNAATTNSPKAEQSSESRPQAAQTSGDSATDKTNSARPDLLVKAKESPVQHLIADGIYVIHTGVDYGQVVEVTGMQQHNGANVATWQENGALCQQWDIRGLSDGSYSIVNRASKKALDVFGAFKRNGANVSQWDQNTSAAQRWFIVPNQGGFRLESALDRKLCLDVFGAVRANGVNVNLWERNNSKAQIFTFQRLHGTGQVAHELAAGVYEIVLSPQTSQNIVLDAQGAGQDWGTNAWAWSRNNATPQRWVVTPDSQGYYTIVSVCNGLALELAGGNTSMGTNAQLWHVNGSDAQKWQISRRSDGNWSIISKLSGLSLDLVDGRTQAGTNVRLWDKNGSRAQSFAFNKVAAVSEGIYALKQAGKLLDVQGSSGVEGGRVWGYSENGALAQRFYLHPAQGGAFYIESVHSGLYLHDQGGRLIQTNNWQSGASEWEFVPSATGLFLQNKASKRFLDLGAESGLSHNARKAVSLTHRSAFDAGIYEVHLGGTHTALDVDHGARHSGANVVFFPAHGENWQKWKFIPFNGHYIIQSGNSDKVLDVFGGYSGEGTNIQQWERNNSPAQLWDVVMTKQGLKLVNLASGKALAVNGSNAQISSNGSTLNFYGTKIKGISGDEELDRIIRDILRSRRDLRSAFNHVVYDYSYFSGSKYPSGNYTIGMAKEMVYNRGGNCYRFASLFQWLARGLGYSAQAVTGYVPSLDGGWAPHGWVEIYQNGQTYVCDPDLTHELGITFFMNTYANAPVEYRK